MAWRKHFWDNTAIIFPSSSGCFHSIYVVCCCLILVPRPRSSVRLRRTWNQTSKRVFITPDVSISPQHFRHRHATLSYEQHIESSDKYNFASLVPKYTWKVEVCSERFSLLCEIAIMNLQVSQRQFLRNFCKLISPVRLSSTCGSQCRSLTTPVLV